MKKKPLYLVIILVSFSSCGYQKICSTPTKREINRAMKYSDWRYIMPNVKIK